MSGTKIASLVFGILVVIGGIFCLTVPVGTFMSMLWVLGIFILCYAISNFATYSEMRKAGLNGNIVLVNAIVSLIFAILLIFNGGFQFALGTVAVILIAVWMIVAGIIQILQGIKMRDSVWRGNAGHFGNNWGVTLGIGVVVTILGIICLFNPSAMMSIIGIIIGLSFIAAGIGLIANAFSK
ncbi:MAG: DUF308 domain-containing protein [Coriobacteriales bacterium]